MRVLVLGADGFIGRHIAFHLRAAGHEVIAQARRPSRLAAMGFAVLQADLCDPQTHDPAFWTASLAGGAHLVNAAGLLTGTDAAFEAVHVRAPKAALAGVTGQAVLVSAIGIEADTRFARWRRETEALFADHCILRPGLVMADTSYGGSSLLRALAALPFATPVVGDGLQPFNPIHARDLAEVVTACLTTSRRGSWEIGGPETLTQAELASSLRQWLGLRPVPLLRLPLALARWMGRLGDALRLGPISATAVAQLETGVLARPAPLLGLLSFSPRGARAFVMARPAGSQDLWHARLYLLKPLIRLSLALLWLASGALGLLLPGATFLGELHGLPPEALTAMARIGGLADLAIGLALLCNWHPRGLALAQLAMVLAYTLGFSLLAPGLWLDPFGGLLKNLPVLAVLLVHLALVEER
jgi:uncharacterized protein YbjT (DUF2867 family)